MNAHDVDVSHLPATSFDSRTTIWWGVTGLIAIEGTMFALLIATYLYLWLIAANWPPLGTPKPGLLAGSVDLVLMLVSVLPMAMVNRAAHRRDPAAIWKGMLLLVVIGLGAIALRMFEFFALHTRWDSTAYGSIAWTILGMHLGHLASSTVENILLGLLMIRGPVEPKHYVDVNVNALYWYFVVGAWIVLYVLVFWGPRFL